MNLVTRALRRQPPADPLRPAHRLALLDARSGPLGFAWLVLEEARELAMHDPQQGEERMQEARQYLAAAGLDAIDAARAHDLEALAWVYLADAQRFVGRQLEAEASFEAAGRALAVGSGRVEVAATLDELRAPWLQRQGKVWDALELLAMAASRLEAPGLEGRRAEVLGRRGALLVRLGDEPAACETIEQALALLPAGQSLALRLFLLHNGAATAARLGRVETAWAYLDQAEPLYALPYGHDFLRAQRFWVRGLVQMKGRQFEAAETSLREAIHRLLELGFGRSAVPALLDLARLYFHAGWKEHFQQLEELFLQLLEMPDFQTVLRGFLREQMGLARRKGVAVPHIDELVKMLAGAGEPPVA